MLTPLDIKNALIFLDRVDLKGKESMPMTDLQIKLKAMLAEAAKTENPDSGETDES